MGEWTDMMLLLSNVRLEEGRDVAVRGFEQSGKYTTISLYRFMTGGGVTDTLMVELWKSKIPMKVQIFTWMAFRYRIQSKTQLKKRRWSGLGECKLCGQEETTDHILFQCPIACFLWVFIRETFGWSVTPLGCDELCAFLKTGTSSKKRKLVLFICAGALWSLWKIRNAHVFDNKMVTSPTLVIHKMVAMLRQWAPMARQKETRRT